MLIVLDSTVLIDYLRGRGAVARVEAVLAGGDVPATTVINVEEIVRGIKSGEEEAVGRLFAGLVVLPVTEDAAWLAGRWRREHAARGVTVHQADALIGAVVVGCAGTLATGNPKDFPMTDLTVSHWPVGQ